jgi:hypothetical protein
LSKNKLKLGRLKGDEMSIGYILYTAKESVAALDKDTDKRLPYEIAEREMYAKINTQIKLIMSENIKNSRYLGTLQANRCFFYFSKGCVALLR